MKVANKEPPKPTPAAQGWFDALRRLIEAGHIAAYGQQIVATLSRQLHWRSGNEGGRMPGPDARFCLAAKPVAARSRLCAGTGRAKPDR